MCWDRAELCKALKLTYEGLVSGLREATLLVQQGEHPHGLLQEEVQQRPVVLVLNESGIHLLIQVLVLDTETRTPAINSNRQLLKSGAATQ